MTTEQRERENQDILMEYFIDGDPSVRRIQCEYCRKVIYTQTRNRKYCSFQTCGHKMLNLRKSLKKRAERGTYGDPAGGCFSSSLRQGGGGRDGRGTHRDPEGRYADDRGDEEVSAVP